LTIKFPIAACFRQMVSHPLRQVAQPEILSRFHKSDLRQTLSARVPIPRSSLSLPPGLWDALAVCLPVILQLSKISLACREQCFSFR